MRLKIRTVASLLMFIACTSCGDYSTAAGGPYPPDTTFEDGLWTASGSLGGVFRLSTAQLLTSGSVAPATLITTSSGTLFTLNGVAFDAAGTMWITSQSDSAVLSFTRNTLAKSGSHAAAVVIRSADGSLSAPSALAFDASHNLWVANHGNGTIVRFDAAQLSSSGAPAPSVILTGTGHPTALAFDADGSLWFSDNVGHRLAKYTAAQLATSGRILPDIVLRASDGVFRNPSGIAFDAAGNLWIANTGRANVLALKPNQLAATGFVHPDIVISPTATFSAIPVGLAFDDHGSLWVVYGDGVITKYDPSALAATGAPAPAVRLDINDHLLFWGPAFWPKPAGLPLK